MNTLIHTRTNAELIGVVQPIIFMRVLLINYFQMYLNKVNT